jgi:hypothetical protein
MTIFTFAVSLLYCTSLPYRDYVQVAAGIFCVTKEDGMTNITDLLTKPLTEPHRVTLLRSVLYNL